MAILGGLDYAYHGFNVKGVVTFGAPRVGDSKVETIFDNVMSQKNIVRARFVSFTNMNVPIVQDTV